MAATATGFCLEEKCWQKEFARVESDRDSCHGFLSSCGFIFFYAGCSVLVSLQVAAVEIGNCSVSTYDGCRVLVSLQVQCQPKDSGPSN